MSLDPEIMRRMGLLPTFEYELYIRRGVTQGYNFWGLHTEADILKVGDRLSVLKKWRNVHSGSFLLHVDEIAGKVVRATALASEDR